MRASCAPSSTAQSGSAPAIARSARSACGASGWRKAVAGSSRSGVPMAVELTPRVGPAVRPAACVRSGRRSSQLEGERDADLRAELGHVVQDAIGSGPVLVVDGQDPVARLERGVLRKPPPHVGKYLPGEAGADAE